MASGVLITGGGGFIGSHLADELLAHSYRVRVLDSMTAQRDDDAAVQAWCEQLRGQGVWANEPVPLFPYPGSPDYRKLWGPPDDHAWERAHAHYLAQFDAFSELQDERPRPLAELERGCAHP